ncbi:hypothetical protein [Nocardia colli]|uniref:hypothetical protein n=1 Tax=Nocardia colli TaxID=2545717 RepID=UPI0035E07EF0
MQKRTIGRLARLTGAAVALAAAAVLTAGPASATGVSLKIDTNGDGKADTAVAVGVGLNLGVVSALTCAVVDPLLPARTDVVASALGVDIGVAGVVVGCS